MKLRLLFTLILFIFVLAAAIPSRAQETASVRFVNLRVGANNIDMTDQNGAVLTQLGPFGTVSDPIEVDASLTGVGYSIVTGSGFSASGSFGTSPRFTAGHEHLVIVIGDDEEDDLLITDITAAFGGADSVADDGLGRLYVAYFVRELPGSAITLLNADGTSLGTRFMALDTESFDSAVETQALALLPGTYTLRAAVASDPTVNLILEQALTLAADDLTFVALVGAYPDAVQAMVISPDGVNVIGAP